MHGVSVILMITLQLNIFNTQPRQKILFLLYFNGILRNVTKCQLIINTNGGLHEQQANYGISSKKYIHDPSAVENFYWVVVGLLINKEAVGYYMLSFTSNGTLSGSKLGIVTLFFRLCSLFLCLRLLAMHSAFLLVKKILGSRNNPSHLSKYEQLANTLVRIKIQFLL